MSYETVPYPGLAFPQTHPDHLGRVARSFGLDAPPAEAARVLEVGCADGMNLVAMAAHVPGLRAVGFDLVEPRLGRVAVAELGLGGVVLERADLRAPRDWGEFDYVIAHGLYAWVPEDAREALMALLARSLAPHGVAFVSHNTLPGARLRTMVREIVLLLAGPEVGRARELYEFLAPWAQDRPDGYGQALHGELERLRRLPAHVLAHDDLGESYTPVWLRDVAGHAAAHGLQWVADAELEDLEPGRHPDGVDAQLDALAGGDRVAWEQYADVLAGRAFRSSVLCRAGLPVAPAGVAPAPPSRAAATAGRLPRTSPLIRWQAARGPELTSLRHDAVRLEDPFGRLLVRRCDGTRDRAALVDALVAAVGVELTLTSGGEPVADGEALRPGIAAGLEENLAALAAMGLLAA